MKLVLLYNNILIILHYKHMKFRNLLKWILIPILFLTSALAISFEPEIFTLDLADDNVLDIRRYNANGENLLLGFACDEGTGHAEQYTAKLLADNSLEVWMPDLLGARFLPKLKSSLVEVPASDVVALIDAALERSDKKLYLIASGPGSAVLLRGLVAWESQNPDRLKQINGVVLLFPRLAAQPPEPGKAPIYIDAVGKTRAPIAVLEGDKTPNKWALPALKKKLQAGGSLVTTALIPGVRGYFYERKEPNKSEDIVTRQLSGLIKASLIKLDFLLEHEHNSNNTMDQS